MHVAVVSVPVSDQASAKAFYVDVLGFDVLQDNPMGPDQRWIQLAPKRGEDEPAGAAITLVTWLEKLSPGGQRGLVLESRDIEADHAALTARGVAISDIAGADWGRYAMFDDPDGNGWVLTQVR